MKTESSEQDLTDMIYQCTLFQEKRNLILLWNTTSWTSKWLKFKRPWVLNVFYAVEKLKISYIDGRDAKWSSNIKNGSEVFDKM